MRGWIALVLFALLLCHDTSARSDDRVAGPVGQPTPPWREQIHWVPLHGGYGSEYLLYTVICRPQGDTSARVAVLNHGSPANSAVRPTMHPWSCDSELARWFLERGYIVVMGMRRGYGRTGGVWEEDYGPACSASGYANGGLESSRDIDALVNYATALPFARHDGAVVVGHSAGGWAVDAYDSRPHPKVAALISMAGGRGGHYHNQPHSNCRPDQLVRAAGIFGATATTPMLWIYAANDSFFSPDLAAAMYAAFTQAGGKAEFHQLPPFGNDGHFLFTGRGGSAIWGPIVEHYLAERLNGG